MLRLGSPAVVIVQSVRPVLRVFLGLSLSCLICDSAPVSSKTRLLLCVSCFHNWSLCCYNILFYNEKALINLSNLSWFTSHAGRVLEKVCAYGVGREGHRSKKKETTLWPALSE